MLTSVENAARTALLFDQAELPLVLTMGDPAGIGPDIAIQAWLSREDAAIPPFMVVGDAQLFAARAAALGVSIPIEGIDTADRGYRVFRKALGVLPLICPCDIQPGQPNSHAAASVIASIERAVDLVQKKQARALVTNPINKKQLYDAGLAYRGHTEFLGALAQAAGERASPIMMLVCDELKVVPATVHVALADVASNLSQTLIVDVVTGTAGGLVKYFGIESPRIAVTGFNPHAGEEGAIGREEIEIIGPAIERLNAQGIDVTGPHPADALFSKVARLRYDAAVTMYHDQALIPIKTLAFDRAVNLTLGLPFVRTSPDHGTAYDLAGTGQASARSLIEALKLADRICANQVAVSR